MISNYIINKIKDNIKECPKCNDIHWNIQYGHETRLDEGFITNEEYLNHPLVVSCDCGYEYGEVEISVKRC